MKTGKPERRNLRRARAQFDTLAWGTSVEARAGEVAEPYPARVARAAELENEALFGEARWECEAPQVAL